MVDAEGHAVYKFSNDGKKVVFTDLPGEVPAKLALALWVAAYLAKRPAPQSLGELARPIGLVVGGACLLVLVEPDLGTAIAISIMAAAGIGVGDRGRALARPGPRHQPARRPGSGVRPH